MTGNTSWPARFLACFFLFGCAAPGGELLSDSQLRVAVEQQRQEIDRITLERDNLRRQVAQLKEKIAELTGDPKTILHRAIRYNKLGRIDKCIELLDQIIEDTPTTEEARVSRTLLLEIENQIGPELRSALRHRASGEFSKAVKLLNQVVDDKLSSPIRRDLARKQLSEVRELALRKSLTNKKATVRKKRRAVAKFDRFRRVTRVSLVSQGSSSEVVPVALATYPGRTVTKPPSHVDFGFMVTNSDKKYRKCHSLAYLIDGRPFLVRTRILYDSSRIRGKELESVWHAMPYELLSLLVNASSVEFQICLDEFHMSTNSLRDITEFYRLITPNPNSPQPDLSNKNQPRSERPAMDTDSNEANPTCCKMCRNSCACGDSCIKCTDTCRKGPGCACNLR